MSKLVQCQECAFIAPENDMINGGDPAIDGFCGVQCTNCDGTEFEDFEGYEVSEYIDGMRDCMNGHPAKLDQSKSYEAGYGAQYILEQIKAATND